MLSAFNKSLMVSTDCLQSHLLVGSLRYQGPPCAHTYHYQAVWACCATLLLCFGWESPMYTWTVCGSPGWGKVPVCCSCAVLHAGPRCAAKHQRRQPWMQHNVCYGRPMLYHIDPRT